MLWRAVQQNSASTAAVVLIGPVPYRFSEFADASERVWEEYASQARKDLLAERLETLDEVVGAALSSRSFAVSYVHRSPIYWADPAFDASEWMEGLESGPAFDRLVETLPSRDQARSRLTRIDAPTLLILGKLDFAIPFTAWENLVDGIEGIDYVLLEADSHNPMFESPARFDAILIDWMDGVEQ